MMLSARRYKSATPRQPGDSINAGAHKKITNKTPSTLFLARIILLMFTSRDPQKVLQQVFGYDAFRHNQQEIVEHVLSGNDAVVLMPTGGGKSLCYQVPALCLPGVTIVVSPLIALMKDQVDALLVSGIKAAYLNSTQTAAEQSSVFQQLKANQLKLLYLAPERLMGNETQFLSFLQQLNVSLFAIDEAH